MHPIVADGGEITVLRSLASHAYGKWDVTWPDNVPEEHRPKLEDDREFAFSSQLSGVEGRMARRFVRSDIPVQAAEYSDTGMIPYTGYSGAEATLDAAAKRTDGDVFFEREFTREHLGGLEPWVDFRVGDLVPVEIWGKTLLVRVTHIEAVTQNGAVIDWRVRVGDSLLRDDEARERNVRQMERDLAQEIRERQKAVSESRSHAVELVAAESEARKEDIAAESQAREAEIGEERRQRKSDLEQVREFLGGSGASAASILSQLAAINAQIINMSDEGAAAPAPGLLNSYLSLNTLLWEQQQEVNRLNREFQKQQAEINKVQTATSDANSTAIHANKRATQAIVEALQMQHLTNHGSWSISKPYQIPEGKDYSFDFD